MWCHHDTVLNNGWQSLTVIDFSAQFKGHRNSWLSSTLVKPHSIFTKIDLKQVDFVLIGKLCQQKKRCLLWTLASNKENLRPDPRCQQVYLIISQTTGKTGSSSSWNIK